MKEPFSLLVIIEIKVLKIVSKIGQIGKLVLHFALF